MTKGIEVANLTKHFGPVCALKNVRLRIRPGEFVTIVGPTGCGKSTLLRILAGLDTPGRGHVTSDEEPIEGPSPERAMVFHDYSTLSVPTVPGTTPLGRRAPTPPGRAAAPTPGANEKRAEKLRALLGLSIPKTDGTAPSPGALHQRVSIARALMPGPAVLLLDDPFSSLDSQTRAVMQNLLLEVARSEGTTTIFATRDIAEAIYLGSRVVLMAPDPGRIDFIYEVPFPRERDISTRLSAPFLDLKRRIGNRARDILATAMDDADHVAGLNA